jgi:hypothetical protein
MDFLPNDVSRTKPSQSDAGGRDVATLKVYPTKCQHFFRTGFPLDALKISSDDPRGTDILNNLWIIRYESNHNDIIRPTENIFLAAT